MTAAVAGATVSGRIGPNAITRLAEALRPQVGDVVTERIFDRAGLTPYLDQPPDRMVDEVEVTRLHQAMLKTVGATMARQVARDAGRRTGDYLLAHRIPRPVQWLLKRLPPTLAARMLIASIAGHAWTFAGSGAFAARIGDPVVLKIRGNPMCRGAQASEPACHYYAATFERLFQALVHRQTAVIEVACEARGDTECRFELHWPRSA
jgi:divinyl protochlorophyllide a 8-vinyl-reductase